MKGWTSGQNGSLQLPDVLCMVETDCAECTEAYGVEG